MKINAIQNNYLNLYKPKIIQRKSKNSISYGLPENSIVNSLNILYTGKIKPWNFERIKEIYNEKSYSNTENENDCINKK